MRIAVTGASGKLGAEIVRATVELGSGAEVIGLARTPEKAATLGVEIRRGDYDDPAGLVDSLRSVDVVLLVSGMDAPERRVEQHRNVINAARANGVTRIVYTSIQGADGGTAFSPVVQSNRRTEADIRSSGIEWVIGRNGIYIEPDIEYIDSYRKAGGITNCAGEGRCGYTTRPELAYAYARMLTGEEHSGRTYNLHGEAISQRRLVEYLNAAFGADLTYTPVSVEAFRRDRVAELGEFLGTVIAGIYQGIADGVYEHPSDFARAAGRDHIGWKEYFESIGPHGTRPT